MRRAWTLLPAAVLTWIVAGLVTTRPESAPAVVAASAGVDTTIAAVSAIVATASGRRRSPDPVMSSLASSTSCQ